MTNPVTRLKADIVETLQILRTAFQDDQVHFTKQPSMKMGVELASAEKDESEESEESRRGFGFGSCVGL